MKHPVWLAELHRQWFAARGKQLANKTRPFSRGWERLLDDAGIRSAEDIKTAEREAEKLEAQSLICLKRHKYRHYRIEGISLPLPSEEWLRALFGSSAPADLRQQSLQHVRKAMERTHPRFPTSWTSWLKAIESAFEDGPRVRPLSWQHPEVVQRLLDLTFEITSKEWLSDTLIREASVKLGFDSKQLERSRRIVESCLTSMFRRPMSLDMIGIVGSQPQVEIAGELSLHLADGSVKRLHELQGPYHITSDLLDAVKATTPAKRILTVENTKTTLRRIASLNADKGTLILACAYPTEGLRRILALLPSDLPIYHFGDTDPAGYQILSKLRNTASRPVSPFLMNRREAARPMPLSEFDRRILPSLLVDPALQDVRHHLEAISSSGDKGDFEQETLGRPDLEGWPFYRDHPELKA